jgi:hypothetical protein
MTDDQESLGRHHASLTTMCFQFIMLNFYHPYGCHLKGRAIMRPAACHEFKTVNYIPLQVISSLPHVIGVHETACMQPARRDPEF